MYYAELQKEDKRYGEMKKCKKVGMKMEKRQKNLQNFAKCSVKDLLNDEGDFMELDNK